MTGFLAALVLDLVRESLTGRHCRYGFANGDYVTTDCVAAPAEAASRHTRVIRKDVAYDFDGPTLVRTVPLWYCEKCGDGRAPLPSRLTAAEVGRQDIPPGRTAVRVFDPNPVVATNDPSLRDHNDAASAVPESSYTHVELEDSPHVTIVDRQAPFVAPADPGVFDRGQDGFEDVSAVFHIDRTQRYLQSLGYAGAKQIAPYAVETDTHAAGGADNSFFVPSSTEAGRGTLYFGTGGTDDAEDADLVVHEYAHALHEWIAPGTFLGTFASQSRAIGEGFGDYWAFSSHHARRVASGRDPFCFADWDARCAGDDPSEQCGYPEGADCLRRLDTGRTMAEYDRGDSAGTEHRNSAIWSGALIALFQSVGKRTADILVVESLFGAPSNPTFATMAQRMVQVDRQLFGGRHVGAICAAMSARGIVTGADCGYSPRGELTMYPSADRSLPIPENDSRGVSSSLAIGDPRTIERLLVRVDLAHPSRGDLRITLTSPDGTRVILQQVSFDRTRDLHATFGLDAESFESLDAFHGRVAAGTWILNVADLRALDAGTLESWALLIQFAGEVPLRTRPEVSSQARVLPVVAHAPGANGAFYRTDLHLFSETAVTAMLLFTPSAEDGRTSFSVAKVFLPAGQVVAVRDVLPSLFARAGTGNLVVDGERVRVFARMHSAGAGHSIEAITGPSLNAFQDLPLTDRVHAGVSAMTGEATIVEILHDGLGPHVRLVVPPFSHLQVPLNVRPRNITFRSSAPIAAYVSVVHPATNDALFFSIANQVTVAPAIRAAGAAGSFWRTDVFGGIGGVRFIEPDGRVEFFTVGPSAPDVLGFLEPFGRVSLLGTLRLSPAHVVLTNRRQTWSQVPRAMSGTLFPVEHSARFRTNLTFIADAHSTVRVTIRDAAGAVVHAFALALDADRLTQAALVTPVVDGRVTVEGENVHVWASVIDNLTGDATILGAR